jgi:pSer/pThr/pTyr-binding forkhead associated (FHA) protein
MWKLSIEDEQGNRTVVNLVREEYSIGRAEDNTVRLTERNISRHHAKLSKNGSGWLLLDLNSYNGCFINGARVSESQRIDHGDLVQLGDYRLEVSDEGTSAAAGVGARAATVPAVPRGQSLLSQPDRLVMVVGPTPGAEFALLGERQVIGRGEECDVSINHSSVSRIHAEIHALGGGRYEIIDRESANGVRINGAELKRSLIDARDAIELGDVVLKFIPAGQIYRAGADESQRIPSLRPVAEQLTPAPAMELASSRGSLGSGVKIFAALLGVGVLVALGMLTLGAMRPDPPAALPEQPPPDNAARALAEAKALLDKNQIEAAHAKAAEIPDDSNARQSPEFRLIEARWADLVITRAAEESDRGKKRELYDSVAKATTVDSVQRKRAASLIAELDATDIENVDIDELPSAPQKVQGAEEPPKPVAREPKETREPAAKPTMPGGLIRKNPYDDGPSRGAAPPKSTNVQDDAMSGDRAKVARAKAALEQKAASGRATEQDLRMLRALCRQLGDSSCSN